MDARESEPMTTPPLKVAARMVVWGRTESVNSYADKKTGDTHTHGDKPVLRLASEHETRHLGKNAVKLTPATFLRELRSLVHVSAQFA